VVAGTKTSQWFLCTLLITSAAINYVDRGSLSIAAPRLTDELGLTPVQLGWLLSAFFWSYALFHLVSGWLLNRISAPKLFAFGYLFWSVGTLLCGAAGGLASLVIYRLMVGVGESVCFPCWSKIIAKRFEMSERGLPNALIDAGVRIGPAVGTFASGMLVAQYGWRPMFYIVGTASLLFLIPWWLWARKQQDSLSQPDRGSGPGVLAILKRKEAWGTFIGATAYTYPMFFLLTWLPQYLVKERGVSMKDVSILGSLPYLVAAVTTMAAGWTSDRLIRNGASITVVRKSFVVTGLLCSVVLIPAALSTNLTVTIGLIILGAVALSLFGSNHWAVSQTLAGPLAAGQWAGIKNSLGAVSGIVAPIMTGWIVQTTGSYLWAFISPALIAVAGAICYVVLIGEIRPLEWEKRSA
jgi:MFS family permease